MSEQARGWRALPPILIVALALDVCAALAGVVWSRFEHVLPSEEKWGLAVRGIYFAVTVLYVVGFVELARRCTGWAARGLRAAALLYAIDTLLWIGVAWYFAVHHGETPSWFETTWRIAALVLRAAPAIGLAIAAWPRRGFAIAGLVLTAAVAAAHHWLGDLAKWLGAGEQGFFTLISAIAVVDALSVALLAYGAARGTSAPEPRRAAVGLSRAGNALMLRVCAAVAGTGIGLLVAIGSSSGEGAVGLVKLGMFAGLVINVVADVMLAVGALEAARAELPDLPRWPLAIAGALLAWSAGVQLEKAPGLYEALYGEHSGLGRDALEALQLFSAAVPVVETLAIGAIAAVIGTLARRRSLEDLRTDASGKGVGFVVLMLASIGIAQWVVPQAKSEGGLLAMMLCMLLAILYAMILMTRLCRLGAEAVEREPGLPAAKVVT